MANKPRLPDDGSAKFNMYDETNSWPTNAAGEGNAADVQTKINHTRLCNPSGAT